MANGRLIKSGPVEESVQYIISGTAVGGTLVLFFFFFTQMHFYYNTIKVT